LKLAAASFNVSAKTAAKWVRRLRTLLEVWKMARFVSRSAIFSKGAKKPFESDLGAFVLG